MWKDEIVDETRKWRDEYAAQFGYDVDKMVKDLKEKEKMRREKTSSMVDKHNPAPDKQS
jgi:hypothetical protein